MTPTIPMPSATPAVVARFTLGPDVNAEPTAIRVRYGRPCASCLKPMEDHPAHPAGQRFRVLCDGVVVVPSARP